MQAEQLIKRLNSPLRLVRWWALCELKRHEFLDSTLNPASDASHINLNIHSDNSFAPYSPTMAAYMAYKSGIKLACLCDYGTINGQNEFKKSCDYLGINTINGFELSVNSKLLGPSIVALYCTNEEDNVEYQSIIDNFRNSCYERAKSVCEKINRKIKKYNMTIDFEKDVVAFSKFHKKGNVTLKHVYMAFGKKIIAKFGKNIKTAEFLRNSLCIDIDESSFNLLCDPNNPFYIYDLILALRNIFNNVDIQAELPSLRELFAPAKGSGIIKAYQYDLKANWLQTQTETAEIIEDFKNIVALVKKESFNAVCITAKNLSSSLLCTFIEILKENELLAIFTEKTEYPRNHFECAVPKRERPYIESCAYAMLGNSICIKNNGKDGLFGDRSSIKASNFKEKLSVYSGIGRKGL